MFVVELAFTPAPERLAARPAHRETLTRLHAEGALAAAGPWADDTGALLLFTVDRARLDEILHEDPVLPAHPRRRGPLGARVVPARQPRLASGCSRSHPSHAEVIMSWTSCRAFQPRSAAARSAEATTRAGSPGRRGVTVGGRS
ncbi:hypothetical protein C1703_15065 [Streptomyces sp. Go-475]|nr:hypothetical protein C1703_15065 [Streptomyces sp. Go-475]